MSASTVCTSVFAIVSVFVWLIVPGSSFANPELLQAADSGNLEVVQAQLAGGADVDFTLPNKTPKYGYLVHTALESASSKGYTEIVALLLANGATVRSDKWYGLYAATWAGQGGYTEILAMLLANTNPESNQINFLFGGALINAVRNGKTDAVNLLLEHGVSADWHTARDHFPRPAILEAARTGQVEIFSTLMEAEADPTPFPDILTLTAMRGDTATVQHLLGMDMDPNDAGDLGLPLSMAACINSTSDAAFQARINATVAVLLEAESKVNVPARGRSPLFCAKEDGNEVLISMLQARDARSFETFGRKLKRVGVGAVLTLGGH